MTTRLTVGFNIVLLLTAAAIARPVHGAEVAASISSEDTYVDSPILFRIDVANVKEHMPPVVPKIDGVEVVSVGTPSQRQFTSIVNGRVYEETTLTHAWRLVPRREGMFVVPPIAVHADGKTFYTRKLSFRATQSVTGDLLAVEIAGKEEHIYVGQAMPLTLRIWLKPYSDARRNITLSEADMWRMVNKDRTNWGMFDKAVAELADRNQRPAGNTVTREGDNGRQQTYYLYEIETNVYPKRPGQLDGSDVTIVVDYPTKVERSRDPFDSFLDSPFRSSVPDEMQSMFGPRLRVTAARPISAVAAVAATGVLPIPEAGRPVDYRGAVGRYQVSAQAKPTNVSAGEPITLYFGVQGDGPMDLVQAPPLSEIPELTKDFLVSDEPLAGIVRDDLKMFSTSLRPRRSGITAIPPIPFSFFDPETKRFATVHTSPISITVAESDQLALDDVITNQPSGGAYANSTSTSSGKQHPVERSGQTVVPDLAFHRHLSVLESHSDERPVLEAFLLLVPPVAFLLTWISVGWPHLAGGSRSTRGRQKRALAQLQKAATMADVASSFHIALATRFEHEATEGVTAWLSDARAITDAQTVEEITHVTRVLEQVQYGGQSLELNELRNRAIAVIRALDRQLSDRNVSTVPCHRQSRTKHAGRTASIVVMALGLLWNWHTAMAGTQQTRPIPATLSHEQRVQLFQEAADAYDAGLSHDSNDAASARVSFETAATKLQMLVDSGIRNDQLLVDLGNTYLKLGDKGRAAGNYYRALHINPRSAPARTNLAFLNQDKSASPIDSNRTSFESHEPDIWRRVIVATMAIPYTVLRLGLATAWCTAWLWFAAVVLFGKRWSKWVLISAIALLMTAGGLVAFQNFANPYSDIAVVATPHLQLRAGNGDSFPAVGGELPTATVATTLEHRDGWVKLNAGNGVIGWSRIDDVIITGT